MSTELPMNDSQITSVTLPYDYSSSSSAMPNFGERLGENAWLMIAYGVGFILNVYLFVVCLHMYRKNYGIIILNQLLINIVYCLCNFVVNLIIGVIFDGNTYYVLYESVPNPPAWAWFIDNIVFYLGLSLFFVQQAALLLLCTNRCLTMINAHWLEFWLSYKMHIIYSAVCWLFMWDFYGLLIPDVSYKIASAYLLIVFILTISMCIGLYIVIYRHLRSTALSTNDRERYRQMRSVANLALMQSLFPIVTHLPTTIMSIFIDFVSFDEYYYIEVFVIVPSPILSIISNIPYWVQPYSAILIAISIVLALGELRRKVTGALRRWLKLLTQAKSLVILIAISIVLALSELRRKVASVLGRPLKFVTQATSQLFPTSNVMHTTKVAPYSTTAAVSSRTNIAHG